MGVARPWPPPPPAPRSSRRRAAVGMGLVPTGFLVFLLGTSAAAVTGILHPVLVALLGFALLAIGGFLYARVEEPRRAVPARTVPPGRPSSSSARTAAPPPGPLDPNGFTTCHYCGTPFRIA
ncbi:MAG: hypothetical protein HY557_01980 [Euryarchaeota archaeon]|nr:hypothetical protein [Euryarchaeota archaeon]